MSGRTKRIIGLSSIGILFFIFLFPVVVVNAGPPSYVGATKCKACHSNPKIGGTQYKDWQTFKMAKALETLKPGVAADAKTKSGLDPQKDYTTDAKCLKCHTTGYGQPGGFESMEKTPDLAGVGCDACHGPGSEYRSAKIMSVKAYKENREAARKAAIAAGLVIPDEKTCTTCHNPENPVHKPFNFAEYKEKIKHWK